MTTHAVAWPQSVPSTNQVSLRATRSVAKNESEEERTFDMLKLNLVYYLFMFC